jgi:hypothetical protein
MRKRRLHSLFDALATAVLASSAVACGGSSSSSPKIDPAKFPISPCDSQTGTYLAVHGLTPKTTVDYVELQQENPSGVSGTQPTTLDKDGTACATATDKIACGSTLNNTRSSTGWVIGSGGFIGGPAPTTYLVTTSGDAVKTITDNAGLSAFLGPIDNPKKAALVAFLGSHPIACGKTALRVATTGGGYELVTEESGACGPTNRVLYHVAPDGTMTLEDSEQIAPGPTGPCGTGRRPAGLARTGIAWDADLGAYFAEVGHLEAASVRAFERLARELRAHRAPARLVRRASRAAKDEVRHAKVTARLAQRFGHEVPAPRVRDVRVRSLEAIARENAVEGCVRETLGALFAAWQAKAASDPKVRTAMSVIARDEARHAELAWEIARWIDHKIAPDARARIDRARRRAIAQLGHELTRPVAPSLVREAGLPSPRDARALFDAAQRELWAA